MYEKKLFFFCEKHDKEWMEKNCKEKKIFSDIPRRSVSNISTAVAFKRRVSQLCRF